MYPKLFRLLPILIVIVCYWTVYPQSSTGTISGNITDTDNAAISGAAVTAKNVATGFTRTAITDSAGRYRLPSVPTGRYEIDVDAKNFVSYKQSDITLDSDQEAVVNIALDVGGINEAITVSENGSMVNLATPEVSTRFDSRRLSELPIAANRNLLNVVLSAPGIAQLGPGQASYATGISLSVNGARIRSNNFMIDGQDVNDPVFTGTGFALNNPDAIQEVRIVTNQFKAEYGRNSGSVVNIVGNSGTNQYHGSVFWFHNDEHLNACSNLDKVASGAPTGFCNRNAVTDERKRAPRRRENQIGFTLGGPLTLPWLSDGGDPNVWKGTDRTFFFVDLQRWSDRSQNSGTTLIGAPTAAGRAVLQSVANGRPQVQALLDFVPSGTPRRQATTAVFGLRGHHYEVELGDLTGSTPFVFDDRQGSVRIDHRLNQKNLIYGRYRADSQFASGDGQVTPPGLTVVRSNNSAAATVVLNSVLSTRIFNDARASWSRFGSAADAENPISKTIPSIAIPGLGMFNNPAARTAFGFPTTLPGARKVNTYQLADAVSVDTGKHSMKFGIELRRTDVRIDAFVNARGQLAYNADPGQAANDISNFINDKASMASINLPLPGGSRTGYFRWYELYAFAQDEWRLRDDLTLTYGVRYEYPGDSFGYLEELNKRILAANGNNPAFRVTPLPRPDANNFMPRIGFNWNPRLSKKGILGFITGGDKLVIRGGYARTYDANFMNIDANMFLSFPFTATQNFSGLGAFTAIRNASIPDVANSDIFDRTIISPDFRAPAADQISIDVQRELNKDLLLQIGYIRTRGTGLMQIVDGNPCPRRDCRPPNYGNRVDPNLEVVQLYTNSASSTYDAMQISLSKRLTNNFSGGLFYTWSTFIDDASDVFGPSGSEIFVSQNPSDRRADRARSSYDRPHRLTGNFVYELPFYRKQLSAAGLILGGWQMNSVFSFQSGAPFTVQLGTDPACAVCGLARTVRPNLNTSLDLSSMTISEVLAAGGANLFGSGLDSNQRVGNAGRNILRADGVRLVDLGIIKNTRLTENVRVQLRADLFNSLNSRNFGIPNSSINSGVNFLNQWATNGGNRRIIVGARLVF